MLDNFKNLLKRDSNINPNFGGYPVSFFLKYIVWFLFKSFTFSISKYVKYVSVILTTIKLSVFVQFVELVKVILKLSRDIIGIKLSKEWYPIPLIEILSIVKINESLLTGGGLLPLLFTGFSPHPYKNKVIKPAIIKFRIFLELIYCKITDLITDFNTINSQKRLKIA